MADDDNSYYGGSIAGGLLGAAAGVALISNPGSVLGALGVSTTVPAAGGIMAATLVTAEAAAVPITFSVLGMVAIAAAAIAVGAAIGHMIDKHMHKKALERRREQHAYHRRSDESMGMQMQAPAMAPTVMPTQDVSSEKPKDWTVKVEQTRQETPVSGQSI